MGFNNAKSFKPSTPKEVRQYGRNARKAEKEKKAEKQFRIESLEKRFRIQIKKCADSNASLRKLLEGKQSRVVEKNKEKFLHRYFSQLATQRKHQQEVLAKDPKARLLWQIKVPKLDISQPGQFCYQVEGTWCMFDWDGLSALLMIAIGKGHRLPELTTVQELVKRAMRQILGFTKVKGGFSLRSPEDTFKLWEPLRKKYMSKKSKKLRERIEAIDEKPRKKKPRVEVVEVEEEIPQKKKKKLRSTETTVDVPKKMKKSKLNGKEVKERAKRAANLKDDNRLKPVGDHQYRKGMGEVWALLPKKGIVVSDFFKAAKKARLDPLRTRQYLSIMRREGSIEVR